MSETTGTIASVTPTGGVINLDAAGYVGQKATYAISANPAAAGLQSNAKVTCTVTSTPSGLNATGVRPM